MSKEIKNLELIVGQKYEFSNSNGEWTRPLFYIGPVPPPCSMGQYNYLAYLETQGLSSSIGWFEFVRESTLDTNPIPYNMVLSRIREDDEILVRNNGELLRLRVIKNGDSYIGQLYTGLWNINISDAIRRVSYADFHIESLNDVKVLPPVLN